MDRDDPAYRSQSDYSGALLRLYDPLVLGPISRYVWRAPAELGVRIDHAGLPAGSRVTP